MMKGSKTAACGGGGGGGGGGGADRNTSRYGLNFASGASL